MIFENAPIGEALMGLDGGYLQVNQALCDITGYSRAHMLEMSASDISLPEDSEAEAIATARLLGGEIDKVMLEKQYLTATGVRGWATKSISLMRGEDGSPQHFIAQIQDITERKEQEQLLAAERRRSLATQTIGRIGSWEMDVSTHEVFWSDSLFELYGIDPQDFDGNYEAVGPLIHPDDRQLVDAAVFACVSDGTPFDVRHRALRSDGEVRWFDASGARDPNGYRVAGAVLDVTPQVLAAQALADGEERFRLAFDTAPVGMAMIGLSERPSALLRVNPAMCALTGRTEAELCVLDLDAISHPDEVLANRAMIEELCTGEGGNVQAEKRFRHPDGRTVWGQLAMSVVRPSDGRPFYGICLVEDITARKLAEEAVIHQSLHDPLTGLANRTLLYDRIEHALAASTRSRTPIGVLYIDLDGFKQVNDSAGHGTGDQVLVEAAARLRHTVRPGDTVARLGGDEFAIVCVNLADLDGLHAAASRVLESLRRPFQLAAGTFYVHGSIGLAISDETSSCDQVLADADAAMYAAKAGGKNRIAMPRAEDQVRAARVACLLPELLDAINNDQLIMYGQPVVDLATGRTVAVETLIRWDHPVRGILAPGEFLDVAENSSLMVAVGQRALAESCRMGAAWYQQLGAAAPDIHVNVSGRQLETGELTNEVLAALDASALPASRLVLELTETHMPVITDSLRADLDRLRQRGVRIAIDDLGTGYSSLARITQLPVDILKIDLRFTAGLGRDPACDAVVRAILNIGHAMGLSVVAEGVETPQQVELLRGYGCETVQGYLYSRPQPEAELVEYLTEHAADRGGSEDQPHDHTVQFYQEEEELVHSVAGYLAAAIRADEVAVVVATEAHRFEFEASMAASGIDVKDARARGALIAFDAQELLDVLMIGEGPDAGRFDALVGGLIRSASPRGRPVRVYGEMVALLCEAGNVNAAIVVERLWNALGRDQPFSLRCAYPLKAVADDASPLSVLCDEHSAVVGLPAFPTGSSLPG